ncbi:MAG: hypothetical protein RL038_1037 [Actinomycetota bacterium]|jgi:hypothetical protein
MKFQTYQQLMRRRKIRRCLAVGFTVFMVLFLREFPFAGSPYM